jgi:hypothetical protein
MGAPVRACAVFSGELWVFEFDRSLSVAGVARVAPRARTKRHVNNYKIDS